MNQPTPAIVAQGAVRRLPRWVLWFFCAAYVLPGFIGRAPWKSADLSAFGVMAELALGTGQWLSPAIGGLPAEVDALLPYWLGAWAIQLAPSWLSIEFAARLPFMGMLVITLIAVWYATYYLARSPQAQPVAFAFGGEAHPTDYARAIADGAILLFMACLGLAQLVHETTPALAQLCCTALLFYATAALPYRPWGPGLFATLGLIGLTLSGGPTMAVLLGLGSALIYLLARPQTDEPQGQRKLRAAGMLVLTLVSAGLASWLSLWHWRIQINSTDWEQWRSLARLLLWFTWPCGLLALWTLWRWRRQWLQPRLSGLHVLLPLWFVLVAVLTTLSTPAADRSLLLSLPALAAIAAFALPTLQRSLSSLIDWFALIFFSGCAMVIWVVWLSLQTGIPAQPARNVARLAPGFVHQFSWQLLALALAASVIWILLVRWRVGRHRSALWKTAVLPAGGAVLCWLLLMSLWLPLLDYARSYKPMVALTQSVTGPQPNCVSMQGLRRSQVAAFAVHAGYQMQALDTHNRCQWLIVAAPGLSASLQDKTTSPWQLRARVGHPADRDEKLFVYQRQAADTTAETR